MSDGETAAFFDLDGTLLTVNSARLWIERERRVGRLGRRQMLEGLFYLAAYKAGFIDIERAFDDAARSLEGLSEEDLRQRTHRWYDEEVRPHAASGAFDVLERHREAGHRLILLTSSSVYEAEKAVAHFGLEHAICNQFEVRRGRFTGRVLRPICYGAGKVRLAEAWAASAGVSLDRSFFYSDSITDRPMLERVGHPRSVAPDPRLRRLSRSRGWPIALWSEKVPLARHLHDRLRDAAAAMLSRSV